MDCDVFRSSITDYLDRVLASSVAESMDQHRIDCESCESFLSQIRLTIDALGGLNKGKKVEPMPPELLRAFRSWKRFTAQSSSPVEMERLKELLGLPESKRTVAIESCTDYEFVSLGELAVEEASRLSVRRPKLAVRFAQLAVEILQEAASQSKMAQGREYDMLGRAWAVLGNCRKIFSDFPGAAQAFEKAITALELGSGDPELEAHLLQIRAQFYADRGRFQDSIDDLDKATEIYREVADDHNEGRTIIGKGKVLGSWGLVEEAIPLLKQGLDLIDPQQDMRLVLVGKHNLVQYLCESSCWPEALELLPETRDLHEALSNPVDLVRFQWLEGKIALDLEDLAEAEERFLEAKSYFVEQGMAYDAALVSLDLALVYLKQVRIPELKNLAAEMVTIFRALGIRREVLAALAFFNKALEIEQTATVGLLQELIETLERTRQREDCRPQLGVSN